MVYNRSMKQFAYISGLAFTLIMCLGIPTYIGYHYDHVVVGIFAGFVFAMLYLIKIALGKE